MHGCLAEESAVSSKASHTNAGERDESFVSGIVKHHAVAPHTLVVTLLRRVATPTRIELVSHP